VDALESDDDVFLSSYVDSEFGNSTTVLDGRYLVGPHVGADAARSLSASLEGEHDVEEDLADYEATEQTLAGYLMAELYAGEKLMFLPGVRIERTSVDATGNELIFDEEGDFESLDAVTTTKDYTAFFPYAHLRYKIADRTNLRAAFTRSMARPNYYDLVPYQFIIEEDSEIERGNAELEPTLAWNYDLLFEHFFENVGLVSGGVFHKQLNDFIFPFTFEEDRSGETFDVVEPRNGESASLTGFEMAFQGRTSMGLGLYGNYTYTTSDAEIPERGETTPLPGQPEHFGNVALTFEKSGFSARVALVFHGEYIFEVGDEAAKDIYKNSHTQLDVALGHQLTDQVRLFVELNNLTDEPLRFYEGSSDRPIQEEYYHWWGTFGVKWDF
jgi:TonB-dependent receptor